MLNRRYTTAGEPGEQIRGADRIIAYFRRYEQIVSSHEKKINAQS